VAFMCTSYVYIAKMIATTILLMYNGRVLSHKN
jgi:hypothetical protein